MKIFTKDAGLGIVFIDKSVWLQCEYGRTIVTNSIFEISGLQESIVQNANLTYNCNVEVDELNGQTEVFCEPNHNLDIYPRFFPMINLKISNIF